MILIIYDPEQEISWWCDVKSYISRHPSLLSGGPYKIVLSTSQQFSHQTKEVFMDIAVVAQSPLALDRQYFSIISVDDISTNQAKRYRAEVLVGNNNDDVVRLAIYQATKHLKTIVEHSSDRRAKYWGDQKPHLITLFIYRDLDDKAHTNWVAKAIWRDTHNSGAQLVKFGKKNDFTEDIDIDFADNQKHQGWREFISGRVITKYQFLKKVERWIARSDELVEQARKLMAQRDEEQIAEDAFENSMSRLAKSFTDEVENNYDDGTTGPAEVRDAEIRYAATIGSGGNVFIAFTDRGLETWNDPKKHSYMVRSYLQRYDEDREMLGFELKKLKT